MYGIPAAVKIDAVAATWLPPMPPVAKVTDDPRPVRSAVSAPATVDWESWTTVIFRGWPLTPPWLLIWYAAPSAAAMGGWPFWPLPPVRSPMKAMLYGAPVATAAVVGDAATFAAVDDVDNLDELLHDAA